MKLNILALPIIIALCAASGVLAQEDDVRNIFFDTLTAGFEPTRVGVDNMQYIGNQYISREDSTFMLYCTRVIQNDIDFYADFELIPLDTFYLRVYEIAEMDLMGWERLGATYLVKLEAEFPGPNFRVRWRLFDTARKREITKGTFEQDKTLWRTMAHDVANEIVRYLIGDEGIFKTKIAYIKKVGDAKELFLADYDGARERQLTRTGTINISPTFSKTGNEIYFTSYLEGDPQLFKVEISTGKVTRVASYTGIVAAPAISPDGYKIACVLTKDGNSEIYVLDLEGRIIKRLTYHWAIDTAPTWSPDGRFIAFTSDRSGSNQIYIMDSDGLNVRRLTYEGYYNDSPVWSARSDRITFVSRTKSGRFDIASIDTSGADYRILTEVGNNENPHFSPDGKHIIFSSTRLGTHNIYTMDITGRNQRRRVGDANCTNPTWSPLK